MQHTLPQAFLSNFLGNSSRWYKVTILAFLIINPIIFQIDPFLAGWFIVGEFIFTLAMALKCYPLQPGGLIAIEAVLIGMTSPYRVLHEIEVNLEVVLLLIFMVAGIYFMKEMLLLMFTKMITRIQSKRILSLTFCASSAFLSAFLDALTVIAVIIAVMIGFYSMYHKISSGKAFTDKHDHTIDTSRKLKTKDLEQFRAFLRSLVMHAGVGTALGGVCTMVGEPQNLIIASYANWNFFEFALRMSPITFPVLAVGLTTCFLLEKFKIFSYGTEIPKPVRKILVDSAKYEDKNRTTREKAKILVQLLVGIWLVIALAFHLASVGLIGLSVIILCTSLNGVTDEHSLGKAFQEALPFTALLAVFFTIVGVIVDQQLFQPVFHWVLSFKGDVQLLMFYLSNGLLSMVSDNVFVGTVYINEVQTALLQKQITRDQFDMLAVAINTGTNLPSVATPNGQAAFLFLLTSALAPLIRLSYGKMVIMAFPYTIALTISGAIAISSGFLHDMTDTFYDKGLIHHHSVKGIRID